MSFVSNHTNIIYYILNMILNYLKYNLPYELDKHIYSNNQIPILYILRLMVIAN